MPNKNRKVFLLNTVDKVPSVKLKAGMRLDVVTVKLADPKSLKPRTFAARLCGGTSTCIALVDINPLDIPRPRPRG